MANIFYLKRGDTYPNIETKLSDEVGFVNLTGASILFRMSEPNTGNLMLEEAATIVLPQSGDDLGKCYYEWETGDTDIVGSYRVEWRVTFAGGKIATFPRGESATEFNQVVIQPVVD